MMRVGLLSKSYRYSHIHMVKVLLFLLSLFVCILLDAGIITFILLNVHITLCYLFEFLNV